jgi:putative ABC transport system permease protein
MTLKDIALKNLLRRKGKAMFVMAGLVIGVATVVSVISFVEATTHDINQKLEKYGANILIVPRTDSLTLTYGGLSLGGVSFEMKEIRQSNLTAIRSIKNAANIAAVGPTVLGNIQVGDNRILFSGIDFNTAGTLKPWWKVKGKFPDEQGVMLGAEVAQILSVNIGEMLEINHRSLKIDGILEPTGSQDDQLVFARLKTAQSLLNKGGMISMVEVAALCNACPVDEMVRQIAEVLPGAKVMAIQQVVKGRMKTLSQLKNFSYGISAVVFFVGGLVVLVTFMGSVRERTQEIGIFRAIGFRKHHVMWIIFLEAGIVSVFAGILGYLLGILGTHICLRLFSESTAPTIPVSVELAGSALIIAIVMGLVSSTYPAFVAARLDPNEALRSL